MRGVPYAHVATSLVAMVDAAIGGKTGVDLRAGKNIAGAFPDPVAVFAISRRCKRCRIGSCAKVWPKIVKAAIIEGDELFESLETLAPHPFWRWPWLEIVAEAVKVKTMIVPTISQEAGMRELLNLGHTFAHALEHGQRLSHLARRGGRARAARGRAARAAHGAVFRSKSICACWRCWRCCGCR